MGPPLVYNKLMIDYERKLEVILKSFSWQLFAGWWRPKPAEAGPRECGAHSGRAPEFKSCPKPAAVKGIC
jgi:hypothetical protein